MAAERKVQYNGLSWNFDVNDSVQTIKDKLAQLFPEIENAVATIGSDNVLTFAQKAGDKGL